MTTNTKRVLTIAAFAIVGLVVGIWLLNGLIAIAPAIAGGIIGGIVAVTLIKGPEETLERVRRTVESAVGKPKPRETDVEYVLDQALVLNQRVRVEEGVSDAVRTKVEAIIDVAEPLVQNLCAKFPSDELTFNTCRMITYHLPRLLGPYLDVPPSDRIAVEDGVIKALDAALADVTEIDKIIRDQGVDAARHRAKTVEHKYSGFGGATAATA